MHRFRCSSPHCGYEFLLVTKTPVTNPLARLARLGLSVAIVASALSAGGFYLISEVRALLKGPAVVDLSSTEYRASVDGDLHEGSAGSVGADSNPSLPGTAIYDPLPGQNRVPAVRSSLPRDVDH